MPGEWTDGTIRRPAAEYLSPDEFRKLFGLSAEWIDERLKDGSLPQPIRVSARTVMYTWRHAVFLQLWLDLNPGLVSAGEKKGGNVGPS